MVPGLALLFSKVMAPRIGGIVVSALVAHTSWHWMAERWGRLVAYDFRRPAMDAAFGAALLRWVLLLLIVVGAAWALGGLYAAAGEAGRGSAEGRRGGMSVVQGTMICLPVSS